MEREQLGDVLREVLRRCHLEPRMRQHAAMDLWPEVVGADIARNSWPLAVRDGVLTVGAANHAWVQTLHLMRAAIAQELNTRAGAQVVSEIKVRVAERRARQPVSQLGANAAGRAAAAPPATLTREEQELVRELAGRIGDAALRAKVGRALAGLMRMRRRLAAGARPCARCGGPVVGGGRLCRACAARR